MGQFCLSCAVYLDLLLVKHAQPLQVDHIGQALSEGQAVRPDLLVQSVVSHQMDVGYPVCCGHRNVFASKLQLNHLGQRGRRNLQVSYTYSAVFHISVLGVFKGHIRSSNSSRVILQLGGHAIYSITHITESGCQMTNKQCKCQVGLIQSQKGNQNVFQQHSD